MTIGQWGALTLCFLGSVSGLAAADNKPVAEPKSKTMLGINVTGSKEAPKVLTIVPWRMPSKLASKPNIEPVWTPVPQPIDPEAFRRSLQLFEQTREKEDGTDAENANQ